MKTSNKVKILYGIIGKEYHELSRDPEVFEQLITLQNGIDYVLLSHDPEQTRFSLNQKISREKLYKLGIAGQINFEQTNDQKLIKAITEEIDLAKKEKRPEVDDLIQKKEKLIDNSFPMQQILYKFMENGSLQEMARDTKEWEDIIDRTKNNNDKYIIISLPRYSHELSKSALFDLNDYDTLERVIHGRNKAISEDELKQFLFHTQCPVKAVFTNQECVLGWYDNRVKCCQEQLTGNVSADLKNLYSCEIEHIMNDKRELQDNSFPEKKIIEEISLMLDNLSIRINNIRGNFEPVRMSEVLKAESKEEKIEDEVEKAGSERGESKTELEQIHGKAQQLLFDTEGLEKLSINYIERGLTVGSSEVQL